MAGVEPGPSVLESSVAYISAGCCGWCQGPPVAHRASGPVGLAVVPGGLDQRPAQVPVPGLGDRSLHAGAARGVRAGVSPMKDPMVLPVNRSQRPVSTASANPVKVETPRRAPNAPPG